MKKLLIALTIIYGLISCNRGNEVSDESVSNSITPVLVTKLIPDNGDIFLFKYDGTKIIELSTVGEKTFFFYTGNLITSTQYLADPQNGVYNVSSVTDYTYDNSERLIKSVTVDNQTYSGQTNTSKLTRNYTYLSAERLKINEQGIGINYNYDIYVNSDNSVKSWVKTNSNGNVIETLNVLYDTKNNPFKNITGLSKISILFGLKGDLHNILEYNSSLDRGVRTYQYNSNGFPNKSIGKVYNTNGTVRTTQVITYEYNHL